MFHLGYSATNNPNETFNKDLKNLLGKRLVSIGYLITNICEIISSVSERNLSFEIDETIPSIRLANRAKKLHKNGFLRVIDRYGIIKVRQIEVPYSDQYIEEIEEYDLSKKRLM